MDRLPSQDRLQAQEERLHSLLLLGLSGDAASHRQFLGALGSHLRAYFRKRLTHLPDDIEDLVQESLLAVHNQRHTYRASQPLTAWVHAIARHKLVDLLRQRASREALQQPWDDALELLAASDDTAAESSRDLDQLLATLPDRHRLPIVHVKLHGLSVVEAARLTGMSESAIKIGVHRGLRALAARIRGTT